jgi:hypothetical protein
LDLQIPQFETSGGTEARLDIQAGRQVVLWQKEDG